MRGGVKRTVRVIFSTGKDTNSIRNKRRNDTRKPMDPAEKVPYDRCGLFGGAENFAVFHLADPRTFDIIR